jgi:class 3 adenylate cyclase
MGFDLVYFGYPQAHEDDAHRAVGAGLGIVEAMENLNASLDQYGGGRLAVHVRIHTGLVVIGDIGAADKREPLALGETPNIAARIQGLAAPDTVVVSATSFRVIQGYFACHDRGAQRCAVWQHLYASLLSCQYAEHRVASKPRSVRA